MSTLYMNKEHGNLVTYEEMLEEAKELYDYGDPTNAVPLSEYYTEGITTLRDELYRYGANDLIEEMMESSGHKLKRDENGSIYLIYYPEGTLADNKPITDMKSCFDCMSGYIQDGIINDIYNAADELGKDFPYDAIPDIIHHLEDDTELLDKTRFNYDALCLINNVDNNIMLIDIQKFFHDSGKDYPSVDAIVYQDDKCDPPFCEEGAEMLRNKMFTPIVSVYNAENDTVTYSTEETFDTKQAAIQKGRELMASGAIEGFSLYNEKTGEIEYSEGLIDIDDVLEACGGFVDIEKLNNGGITVDAPKSEGFPEKQEQKKKTIQERD